MKHIGIVGGLSPQSTVEYYQIICQEFNRRFGRLNFPQITIRSINLEEIVGLFARNNWDAVAAKIVDAIADLKNAGAEFAAIAANTPHNAYEAIARRSPLPVLSIMEATAKAILETGLKKVGLLGTRATMEYGFFQKAFQNYGIETVVPDAKERAYIDKTIWERLSHGDLRGEDRDKHRIVMGRLLEQGAQGMILGCTELPLLIKTEDSPVPLFDTARLHALAIFHYASKGRSVDKHDGVC